MYGLSRYGIKPGLDVITSILTELDHPEDKFRSVHITGTNGKGSTAVLLESALRAGGLKTALYTSPHIYRFNERVKVAGQEISDQNLLRLIAQVKTAAAQAQVQPTFFEFTTAVAFTFFAQQQVELAVIEVGMGGLLDATNVIKPEVSVITNVGLDHTAILGETTRDIAQRKAGIIKERTPLVTAETDPTILQLFERAASAKHATVYQVAEQLATEMIDQSWASQSFATTGVISDGFTIRLLGQHQVDNAATALLTLHLLRQQGIVVSRSAIKHGLLEAQWEGRLDLVSRQPFVLVDGAHNPDGIKALEKAITSMPRHDVLITGVKVEHDPTELSRRLAPLFDHVITTEGVYQPMPAQKLAQTLSQSHPSVEAIAKPRQATQQGLKLIGSAGAMLIAGSLYMIPEALAYLRQREPIGVLVP